MSERRTGKRRKTTKREEEPVRSVRWMRCGLKEPSYTLGIFEMNMKINERKGDGRRRGRKRRGTYTLGKVDESYSKIWGPSRLEGEERDRGEEPVHSVRVDESHSKIWESLRLEGEDRDREGKERPLQTQDRMSIRRRKE